VPTKIVLSGKGGCGKSTLAALIITRLIETQRTPVLAVDADPNATLGEYLGLPVDKTIGDVCEGLLNDKDRLPAGVEKKRLVDYRIQECLIEGPGVDLLTMGRGEGPRCYCYLNTLLREYVERLEDSYPFVVVDHEAGMEHLSRKTSRKVDLFLIVSQATVNGLKAAVRIHELARDMELAPQKEFLILNGVADGEMEDLSDRVQSTGLPLLGIIPLDPVLRDGERQEAPVKDLVSRSVAYKALCEVFEKGV
jgi:CO dehydrogenase maturation factor